MKQIDVDDLISELRPKIRELIPLYGQIKYFDRTEPLINLNSLPVNKYYSSSMFIYGMISAISTGLSVPFSVYGLIKLLYE